LWLTKFCKKFQQAKIAIIQNMVTHDGKSDYLSLKDKINFHSYRYHVLDDPVISDFEFDQLLQKLRAMEERHPEWITPDSPTQRSGAPPADKFTRVPHPAPILSLANAFSVGDVAAWFESIQKLDERVKDAGFVLEPKIDGLTVVLHYQDGVFVQEQPEGTAKWAKISPRISAPYNRYR
jgi:DNA ligase (NAD+)